MPFSHTVLRGVIRASHMAITTADTDIFIHHYKTVFVFMHRAARADFDTSRIFTVVTGNRQIIRKHIMLPAITAWLPITAGIFVNPSVVHIDRQIFVILTRQFTGFATGTAIRINVKTILFTHNRLLTLFRSGLNWNAADCLLPKATDVVSSGR